MDLYTSFYPIFLWAGTHFSLPRYLRSGKSSSLQAICSPDAISPRHVADFCFPAILFWREN
jgi:hypothetical protein